MTAIPLELAFDHSTATVQVPAANLQAILAPQQSMNVVDPATLLRKALAHPIGTPRLSDLARPGQNVVIVTSDLTRPCPSEQLLPPVLEELARAGVAKSDTTIVVALGLHRPMTETELEAAVGLKVYRSVRVINHDPMDTVRLGVTSAGTPVEIFRPVVEADLRICLGNVELHYFAGYSGGAKAILPGCASRATVQANHAMMVRAEAATGQLEGNPVRADLEEGVAMLGVDFISNVVVDGDHSIVGAFAGDVTAAHRRGCELVARRSMVSIPRQAGIVLVSAGGYPKDVNLYQAQKALDNAMYAVRPEGIIILVAKCREGLGNQTFQTWMMEASRPEDVLQRIQKEFILGGHKAAAIASVLLRARVYLVSGLPNELARQCGFSPFDNVNEALKAALGKIGPTAEVIVLPQGGSILPAVNRA